MADPVSQGNIERLFSLNPETAAEDHEFFRKMNESEDFKREMLRGAMALQHGFFPSLSRSIVCCISLTTEISRNIILMKLRRTTLR